MQSFPFPPPPWCRPPVMRWPKPEQPYALKIEVDAAKRATEEVKADLSKHEKNGTIHVTAENKAAWNGKYEKPSTGIPKADLASDVKASLGKADTALQQHQSLDGYATEEWVGEQGFLTEHQDITGKADLVGGKVPSSQLPSYVDDVLENDSRSAFPATGEAGKIYVAKDTNKTYRWSGTQYVEIAAAPVTSVNGKTGAVVLSASDVGALPSAAISDYRTASAQDAIDGAQDTAIAAKYTKPATGIPASDLASGVIPTVPVTSVNTKTGAVVLSASDIGDGQGGTILGGLQYLDSTKQGAISHLATIRSGAAAGATAVQPSALGTAASKNVPSSGNASATQVVMGNDSRLSNARTPTAHASTHAANGSDPITPASIGAMSATATGADIVAGGTGPGQTSSIADNLDDLWSFKADADSPTLTGTPTAPTAQAGENSDLIATTAFVQTELAAQRNMLAYTSGTTLSPRTAVYRTALGSDGTFPTVDATAIPSASAYFCFELELAVPATVPAAITGPTGWVWIDGHGLPDPADLSGGETICISVRLDCTARTFLASVWRVA